MGERRRRFSHFQTLRSPRGFADIWLDVTFGRSEEGRTFISPKLAGAGSGLSD
jgi:hypothetical protein